MQIKVIAVGKLKEDYLKRAISYYSKGIKSHNLELVEVPDERAPENYSSVEIQGVNMREGQKILSHISKGAYVIALDILGKQMSTEKLRKRIKKINNMGYDQISFIIGGSNGLSKEVLQRSNARISFSPMTFPHQLMRVILVEQLRRIV